jgi:DNA-binding CsgD family transcriptional regulator
MSTEHQLMTQEIAPAHSGVPAPKYKRLTQAQLGIILALSREGKTQTEIAQVLGVTQPTISDAIKSLGVDSTELAIHTAKSRAYRAVRRLDAITQKGKDEHAIKASSKLLEVAGVLNGDSKGVSVGVQVIIGDGPDPLAGAKVVNVCTTDGAK